MAVVTLKNIPLCTLLENTLKIVSKCLLQVFKGIQSYIYLKKKMHFHERCHFSAY